MWKVALVVAVLGSVAHAGGVTTRFGLTGAITDHSAPDKFQLGPLLAVGERLGPFVGELEYAYLSFFDDSAVHRVGLTLRADLARSYNKHCIFTYGCTQGTALYAEAGAGERLGHWIVDASHTLPASGDHQPEAHITLGLELENQLAPYRNGWQFALRYEVMPVDAIPGVACRSGSTCTVGGSPGGVASAVYLEWVFLLGR